MASINSLDSLAYRLGFCAGVAREPRSECPFAEGCTTEQEWRLGWYDGTNAPEETAVAVCKLIGTMYDNEVDGGMFGLVE